MVDREILRKTFPILPRDCDSDRSNEPESSSSFVMFLRFGTSANTKPDLRFAPDGDW